MAYQYLNERKLAKALEKYTAFLAQEQDAPFVSFADSEKRTKTLGEETYKEKNQKRANQEIEYSGTRDTSVRAFGNQHSGK